MKTFTFASAALLATLSATSAFASNLDHGGDYQYEQSKSARATSGLFDMTPTGAVKDTSGFVVTYPTNADSILNVAPANRGVLGNSVPAN